MSMCCGSWYICPTTGEDECTRHGGFASCCADLSCPVTLPYAHLVDKCAAKLHQDYRKAHKGENIVELSDEGVGVNVVQLTYSKLPEDVQVQYVRAAWRGLRNVERAGNVERAAELIHAEWVACQGDEGGPLDRLPYSWLPASAKEQNRVVARTAAKLRSIELR